MPQIILSKLRTTLIYILKEESMNYDNTPSLYNNEEFFTSYLGMTSYYNNLQNVVGKIVGFVKPKRVLELGSALGTTSIKLSKTFSNVYFEGIEKREDIVLKASEDAQKIINVSFKAADMESYVKRSLRDYELIFMLYSFHHIVEPLDNKEKFLKTCYKNMKEGSYLLITETFLPEHLKSLSNDKDIEKLWNLRATEGYSSTFWTTLKGLEEQSIKTAKDMAQTSMKEENEAGYWVYERREEYLVKPSWLIDTAERIGFKVVIAEPVNCIEENAILLRK